MDKETIDKIKNEMGYRERGQRCENCHFYSQPNNPICTRNSFSFCVVTLARCKHWLGE